jgi:hypothetical protein
MFADEGADMAIKHYKVTAYIQVGEEDLPAVSKKAIQDYCARAVMLDLDTEEHGNPYGVGCVVIDWATLTDAHELDRENGAT